MCSGVLVGTARFDPPDGLAHAPLTPAAGYASVAIAAQALGHQFVRTQFWSPVDGDFADVAASRWEGGRLALEDASGRELGVNNIVVIAGAAGPEGTLVRVVADFRPDLARVEAFLRTLNRGGGGSGRPAA